MGRARVLHQGEPHGPAADLHLLGPPEPRLERSKRLHRLRHRDTELIGGGDRRDRVVRVVNTSSGEGEAFARDLERHQAQPPALGDRAQVRWLRGSPRATAATRHAEVCERPRRIDEGFAATGTHLGFDAHRRDRRWGLKQPDPEADRIAVLERRPEERVIHVREDGGVFGQQVT